MRSKPSLTREALRVVRPRCLTETKARLCAGVGSCERLAHDPRIGVYVSLEDGSVPRRIVY